jgi:NAD+ kinase
MQPGEHIELSKSKSVTTFIRMQHGFMDALREKLGWTGKPKLI